MFFEPLKNVDTFLFSSIQLQNNLIFLVEFEFKMSRVNFVFEIQNSYSP